MRKELHKQHEMDMANASLNVRWPKATYISPARVGHYWVMLGHFWLVLVIIDSRCGVALDLQEFLDTNMLVTRNSHIGGIEQRKAPTRRGLRCSGI